MTRMSMPQVAPLVRSVGAKGWMVLGLAAGAALAWQLAREVRSRSRRPRELGPWQGEAEQSARQDVAIAS